MSAFTLAMVSCLNSWPCWNFTSTGGSWVSTSNNYIIIPPLTYHSLQFSRLHSTIFLPLSSHRYTIIVPSVSHCYTVIILLLHLYAIITPLSDLQYSVVITSFSPSLAPLPCGLPAGPSPHCHFSLSPCQSPRIPVNSPRFACWCP